MERGRINITTEGIDAGVRWLPFGAQLLLPERFAFTADDERWPVCRVECVVEDGRPQVTAVQIERREGEPALTGNTLRRLPLATLVREGTARVAVRSGTLTDDAVTGTVVGVPVFYTPDWAQGLADTYAAFSQADRPRRGTWMSDEHLERVAQVYRDAVGVARPPTQAVAQVFEVPRPTAARWVMRARERGFLEPASRSSKTGNKKGGRRK